MTQPVVLAAQTGVRVIEINPHETPVSDLADFRFAEPAGVVMPALLQAAGL